MYSAQAMAKDQTFKLRLDAQDRERLEAVAAHFSAPAATAIRMLIKEKYEALKQQERSQNPFGLAAGETREIPIRLGDGEVYMMPITKMDNPNADERGILRFKLGENGYEVVKPSKKARTTRRKR